MALGVPAPAPVLAETPLLVPVSAQRVNPSNYPGAIPVSAQYAPVAERVVPVEAERAPEDPEYYRTHGLSASPADTQRAQDKLATTLGNLFKL